MGMEGGRGKASFVLKENFIQVDFDSIEPFFLIEVFNVL